MLYGARHIIIIPYYVVFCTDIDKNNVNNRILTVGCHYKTHLIFTRTAIYVLYCFKKMTSKLLCEP